MIFTTCNRMIDLMRADNQFVMTYTYLASLESKVPSHRIALLYAR